VVAAPKRDGFGAVEACEVVVAVPKRDGLAAGTEPKAAAGALSPPRDDTWAASLAKSGEPNAGFTAAGVVVVVEPVPLPVLVAVSGAELLPLFPEAGTEPNTVTGVVVVVAPLPNMEPLAAGAFEPNKEGVGLSDSMGLNQSNGRCFNFAPFVFSSSSSGASSTVALKTGALPFKEAEKEMSGSFFKSAVKPALVPVKPELLEATWANGDSVGEVVFAYSAKGGSLTRTFFLTSFCEDDSGVSGGLVLSETLVVRVRVGDVSSGKLSAGSVRVLLERFIENSRDENLDVTRT
jgi:hypothetical protein